MKLKKILKYSIILLVVIFLLSYLIEMSGYYEYNLQSQKNLTEALNRQFEADIKAGKDISLNDYLKNTTVDYSSKLTRTTSEASLKLNNYLREFLTSGFKFLEKFVK